MAYNSPMGPVQPSGFHGIPSGTLLPDRNAYPPAAPASDPMVTMDDGTVMPKSQADAILASPRPGAPYGTLGNQPPYDTPPAASNDLAGMPGATPTEATAAATAPVQSAWSLALQQRMANGGMGGGPMDFYNFVRNRGAAPTPDAAAPAPMMQAQPRPLVIGPTNTSPAQIIPQPAPMGPGGMPPVAQPPMPQVAQPAMPPRPQTPVPGQMPGGVPQNPQMPGFFPQGRGLVR